MKTRHGQLLAAFAACSILIACGGPRTVRHVGRSCLTDNTGCASGLFLLAGGLGGPGYADGPGSEARLNPSGIAVDSAGNVYVAEWQNDTIRKVTPAGLTTTLAGTVGQYGNTDGTGGAARFTNPIDVALDSAGNVYVADQGNAAIRRVTPQGVVTTLAGGVKAGSADGTGPAAEFETVRALATDSAGNIYVADAQTVRKVTPEGVVTTLAGAGNQQGSNDGKGSAARFGLTDGIAVDAAGNIYVADAGNGTIRKVTQDGVVTTLAGSVEHMGSSIDGTGSAAGFETAGSLAIDSAGNLYVADGASLRKVTQAGVVTTLSNNLLGDNLAVDNSGNIYVSDGNDGTIVKMTPTGTRTTLAGEAALFGSADGTGGEARFWVPFGVAMDHYGDVLVADWGNEEVREIAAGGIVTTLAGHANSAGTADGTGRGAFFWSPAGVAVGPSGDIYVTDAGGGTIRQVTWEGVVTTLVGPAARITGPIGISVIPSGDLFVADNMGDTLFKVTAKGAVTTLAGEPWQAGNADGTGSAARFRAPTGVAVDGDGNIYVADWWYNVIRKVTPDGVVTTLAGDPARVGDEDGIGSTATFDSPEGLAVDAAGNVYVADEGNSAIRKITPAGVVTTVIGTRGVAKVMPGPLPASLNTPMGVAVSPSGDLIISDENAVLVAVW